MSAITIEPGPAKIAVVKLAPSQEVRLAGVTATLWVPTSGSSEGVIGKVVATCKPYSNGNGEMFQSNYDLGDMVIIGKYTGTKLDLGRDEYIILREEDVLAKIVLPEEPADEPAPAS